MRELTLAQLGADIALLVGIIGGLAYMTKGLKEWFSKLFDEKLKPIDAKIDNLSERIEEVDMQQTKNYLVRCMNDIEQGRISDSELTRFWEQYDHYTASGGNSYIVEKVEKLKEKGLL